MPCVLRGSCRTSSVPATIITIFLSLSLWMVGCSPSVPADAQGLESMAPGWELYQRSQPMMGTRFEIQVVSADAEQAARAIDAAFDEVARVEALISEWRSTSEISAVNREGHRRPVTVGPDLFEVVQRGQEVARMTGGAFDLTFAGCGHLWSVGERRIPDDEEVDQCLRRVDPSAIFLDPMRRTIALATDEVRLGVGGIGKGYGVDRAAMVLKAMGIENFVVDGGGDLRVEGHRIDRPWSVGVVHPRAPQRLLGVVTLPEGSVVTSGDYERYFIKEGRRYHHIIDPSTGRPATESVAVTVIAADATAADALATGLFVMGPKAGIALADELHGVEAMIVAPDLTIHTSRGFDNYFHLASTDRAVDDGGLR